MPRHEPAIPWAARSEADRQIHPRKNFYFDGPGMREAFDFFVWQGATGRHLKLDGKVAKTSSEVLADVLLREFLRRMLRPRTAAAFRRWREGRYHEHGLDPEAARFSLKSLQLDLLGQLRDQLLQRFNDDEAELIPLAVNRKYRSRSRRCP